MRKITLNLLLLLLFIGCNKKEEINIDETDIIVNELKIISVVDINKSLELNPCNENNPFDNYGEAFYEGLKEAIAIKKESIKNGNSEDEKFNELLTKTIQKEFLVIDTNGVNIDNVNAIFGEFILMYDSRNELEAFEVSRLMENYILNSKLINENNKEFLLKVVSIIRYGSYYSVTNQTQKKSSFEDCWIKGLKAVQDSGLFTQLACLSSWPICYGAILADCAIG